MFYLARHVFCSGKGIGFRVFVLLACAFVVCGTAYIAAQPEGVLAVIGTSMLVPMAYALIMMKLPEAPARKFSSTQLLKEVWVAILDAVVACAIPLVTAMWVQGSQLMSAIRLVAALAIVCWGLAIVDAQMRYFQERNLEVGED